MNYFIDFEATQFTNEIISVGCISETGETFYSLVKPAGKITHFIEDLTGITQEMLDIAPNSNTVFEKMFDWVMKISPKEKNIFYCYGNTDVQFLKVNINKSTDFKAGAILSFIRSSLIDYAPLVKLHYGLVKSINLGKIANHIRGYEIKQNHNALDDAALLKYVYDEVESTPVDITSIDLAEYRIANKPVEEGPVETSLKIEKENGTVFMCGDKKGNKVYKAFTDIDEAVSYIIKKLLTNPEDIIDGVTAKRIGRRIKNASIAHRKYFDKYWFIIN